MDLKIEISRLYQLIGEREVRLDALQQYVAELEKQVESSTSDKRSNLSGLKEVKKDA